MAIINNYKQINKSESYDYVVDLPIGNFPFNVCAFITIIHYKMSNDTVVITGEGDRKEYNLPKSQ